MDYFTPNSDIKIDMNESQVIIQLGSQLKFIDADYIFNEVDKITKYNESITILVVDVRKIRLIPNKATRNFSIFRLNSLKNIKNLEIIMNKGPSVINYLVKMKLQNKIEVPLLIIFDDKLPAEYISNSNNSIHK
ncbi:MAG: hypothetical protein OEZ01_15360 [Candidatus Heimdallarchaeota archaeon]|nr:hypothetical protein [Candidatus Heimdallarchaeota archaeon]MDH5647387.1 hypothetical protein [Candidatus Heimdallarchaeota archaeon]